MKIITSMTMVDKIIGSAPFVYEGDFAQGVKVAKQLGYDGVELHIANPQEVDAEQLQQALAEHQMKLTAIGTGRAYVNEGLSLIDANAERRQAAVQRVEALEYLSDSMQYLDEVAQKENVTIVFEPINRYENNFLCTVGEVLKFVDSCHLKNTGVLIDIFHMNIEEADLLQAIAQCKDKLKYVHFSDSNRYYPGAGHTDMQAVLHQLLACGYCGVLSAEILPKPTKEEAAKSWIEAVTRMVEKEQACAETTR